LIGMKDEKDIRWKQRFSNYQKPLKRLQEGVEISTGRDLSVLEKQGLRLKKRVSERFQSWAGG